MRWVICDICGAHFEDVIPHHLPAMGVSFDFSECLPSDRGPHDRLGVGITVDLCENCRDWVNGKELKDFRGMVLDGLRAMKGVAVAPGPGPGAGGEGPRLRHEGPLCAPEAGGPDGDGGTQKNPRRGLVESGGGLGGCDPRADLPGDGETKAAAGGLDSPGRGFRGRFD